MAKWTLSTKEKKSCVEREFWTHPDYSDSVIVRETGWRWGTFTCESDERPNIDLDNPDGFHVYDTEYDFELDSMHDGCWEEWTWPDDMPEEERERLQEIWEEDDYSGWEEQGMTHDDTEVVLFGPLELEEST